MLRTHAPVLTPLIPAHISTNCSESSSKHLLSGQGYDITTAIPLTPAHRFLLARIFPDPILGLKLGGSGLLTQSSLVPDAVPLVLDSSVGVILFYLPHSSSRNLTM